NATYFQYDITVFALLLYNKMKFYSILFTLIVIISLAYSYAQETALPSVTVTRPLVQAIDKRTENSDIHSE
ncbi:21167_t:CDS:1, partial [Dentiscutata erythropus]